MTARPCHTSAGFARPWHAWPGQGGLGLARLGQTSPVKNWTRLSRFAQAMLCHSWPSLALLCPSGLGQALPRQGWPSLARAGQVWSGLGRRHPDCSGQGPGQAWLFLAQACPGLDFVGACLFMCLYIYMHIYIYISLKDEGTSVGEAIVSLVIMSTWRFRRDRLAHLDRVCYANMCFVL